MKALSKHGLPTLGRTAAGRLRALVGRAGDPCCCAGGGALKARECCDGTPEVWVEVAAAARCGGPGGVIRLRSGAEGEVGRCFTISGEFASDADIARLGLHVVGGNAVECMTGCADDRCPSECPSGCCVFAWTPGCEEENGGRCCVLGSAYRLRVTRSYHEVQTRPASNVYFSSGCEPPCIYDPREVTNRRSEVIEAEMVWHGEDPVLGGNCSGIENYARTVTTRSEHVWITDGDDVGGAEGCAVRARNGRYVDNDSSVVSDVPLLQRGEMPAFRRAYDGEGNPRSCSGHFVIDQCMIAYPEPCPNPSNPNQGVVRRSVWDVRGSATCDGGEQLIVEVETLSLCGEDLDDGPPRLATEVTRREWRLVWTVEVMSWEGCEVRQCPQGLRAPEAPVVGVGGAGKVSGVKGCGGCKGKSSNG